MSNELEKYLVGMAVGIRYRVNFSLEDQLGKIVDQLLYSKNSFFHPEIFPRAQSFSVTEKRLINESTGDQLIINNSNIILEINFGGKFQSNDMQGIMENFKKDVVDGVMKNYRITEINRIGLIHKYLFDKEALAKSFIDKTIGSTLEGINDIKLTFSKKIPDQDSIAQKGVNDYNNVIFNVLKKADDDLLYMSIDYQKYFDPFLETATLLEFDEFVRKASNFNSKSYFTWLTKNYGVIQ